MASNRQRKKLPSLRKRLREAEQRNSRMRTFTLVGNVCDITVKLPQERTLEVRAFCYSMESNPIIPDTPIKLFFNHAPTIARI